MAIHCSDGKEKHERLESSFNELLSSGILDGAQQLSQNIQSSPSPSEQVGSKISLPQVASVVSSILPTESMRVVGSRIGRVQRISSEEFSQSDTINFCL